jgi:hypothetical protein
MKPRRTWFTNKVAYIPGDNEDSHLHYRLTEVQEGQYKGYPILTTVWEPTPEERAAIAAGQNIELQCWAVRNKDGSPSQPPMSLGVTDTPLGKPPDLEEPDGPFID